MGLLDSYFGSGAPRGGLLGGISQTLFNDPNSPAMFNFASRLMANGGPSKHPVSFGQAFDDALTGAQDYHQKSRRAKQDEEYRAAQSHALMVQATQKEQTERARREAIDRISQGFQSDPNYKPSFADLAAVDADSAFKSIAPAQNAFGLEPKIGKNPATGELQYFIQSRDGGTKWLDAEVPPNLKYVPGNDYQPAQVFDPRRGLVGQPDIAGQAQFPQSMGPTHAQPLLEQPQMADPAAPWNNLTSPKEQDQMKSRVFEQDNKRLDGLREVLAKGRAIMADLNRFGALNQQTGTGSLADRWNWPTFDPDKKEMEAIISRLGPQLRAPGSGADSDFEQKLRLNSLPSLGNYGDTNKAIREGYARQVEAAQNELNFRQSYLTEHGHLNGADQAYQTFLTNLKAGDSVNGGRNAQKARDSAHPDWNAVNARFAEGASAREQDRLGLLKRELANATDPNDIASLQREISRVQPAVQATGKKRTKAVQFEGGGSAFAELAPDGHYYVKVGGKRYRVED